MPDVNLPLDGVRVLDLGQGAAGPYCGQLLADFGADVIKVEPPRGDWSRGLGAVDPRTGLSSTYVATNRNKRGICVDLADEADAAAVRTLAGEVDIVVESFRPGVLDGFGLGSDALLTASPRLIYCSITGFGATGPEADRPASDSMMQAYGGLMSIVGEPGGPPLRVGTIVSDMLAATNAFSGILLALYRRERTGAGGRVEVSLLDSLLAFQSTGLTDYLITGTATPPPGNRHPLIGASGIARAADGYLAVGVLDHYWDRFCAALGLDDLAADTRFSSPAARLEHQEQLWESLDAMFSQHAVEHWIEGLTAVGVVCSRVHDYPAVVADLQVRHNRMLGECDADGAVLPMVAPPLRLDGVLPRYAPPPLLGQHTADVLGR